MQTPKLNQATLTPEQRDKLETYQQAQAQLQALSDIADMTQEMVNILDDQKKLGGQDNKQMGALLMDMRDTLQSLNAKEAPETPDTAKPVVDALSKLEKALTTALKAMDTKPETPQVNVAPAKVDLSGVEKAVADIPKAFEKAIKAMPQVEIPETDNSELLQAWQGISEQLVSIEHATRLKPLPGSMKVTNPDGSYVGSEASKTERYDYDDSTTIYTATAAVGTSEASLGWTITKYDLTDSNNASGKIATNVSWTNRSSGSFA